MFSKPEVVDLFVENGYFLENRFYDDKTQRYIDRYWGKNRIYDTPYMFKDDVFYRLGFAEIFGTGITRIKQLYAEGLMKPDFEVSENAIKIVLPLFEKDANLTEDEKVIYKLLSKTVLKPISEIAPYTPFGKSKTTKLLKDMGEKGVIAIEGRGTKYIIK